MNLLTLALTSVVALSASALWIQQDAKPKRFTHPQPKDMNEAMERWVATFKPGAAHERLAELVGKYETTQRMWMGGPGSKPTEITGTCEIGWFSEGKWLEARYTSTGFDGKPSKGLWILGYDNFKERYVMTHLDSLQTCMNSAFGHFEQSGDHLILWGTIDEPMTPEQDKQVKYVFRNYGKERFAFEIHDMMIGESNTKVVEVEYRQTK